MDVKKLVEKYYDYVIEMRRYFHENPELSMEEYETTKRIAEELDKMGIKYEIPEEKVGVIGVIEGKEPGKVIALRADMDALNVTEKNDVEYKSKVDGKMHACGHDAHTAMLLGAAQILNEVKDQFKGKVYLLFQPGEEVGKGAKFLMNHGDWYDEVDSFFGTHVWSPLETGKVSLEGGERMAAADKFTITIHGKSGHGSLPHETIDPVVVGSSIVMNLQTLVSRKYSPLDSVTVTVGSFHSGNRFNIIPNDAVLEGTNRYFSQEISDSIEEDMKKIIENIAAAYGATVELDYERLVLPTYNDPAHSEIAEKSAAKIIGEENVSTLEKTTGGEDFSFYLQDGKPGVFAFVGVRNSELGTDYPQHSERYNVDESVLPNGAGIYAQYTIDYLNS